MEKVVCENCGAVNLPDSNFCEICGAKLNQICPKCWKRGDQPHSCPDERCPIEPGDRERIHANLLENLRLQREWLIYNS